MKPAGRCCAICGRHLEPTALPYPRLVCGRCGSRALNSDGKPALTDSQRPENVEIQARAPMGEIIDFGDGGDNPVFINGFKCWRRYKFGGFVTLRDFDSATLREFNRRLKALTSAPVRKGRVSSRSK